MAPPLLLLQNISLTHGGKPLLEGASLSVSAGERLCLVGRNGSGKSTLLNIAAGLVEPDSGTRFLQPGVTLRYLPQEPDLAGHATTYAYVEAGLGPADDRHRARLLLNELGLTGEEAPAQLSGGEARRAALARVLAPEPDILLLDEPTNHLDLPAIEWLEAALQTIRSALVIISHDRRFLHNLSRGTVWLDRGRTRILARGFAEFEAWRDAALEEEVRAAHKFDRKIAAEEDWLRYGVTARRKRNQKRLANLVAMRNERRQRRASREVKFEAAEADLSGKLVIEAKDLGKSFGAQRSCQKSDDSDFAGRSTWPDRRQWRGQDDAYPSFDRYFGSGPGLHPPRRQSFAGNARPGPGEPRSGNGLEGCAHRGRQRFCRDQWRAQTCHWLYEGVFCSARNRRARRSAVCPAANAAG